VNVLKSLVDWETLHRESQKQSTGRISLGNELSAKGSVEIETGADISSHFENAKPHKSIMDAAIAEVRKKLILQQRITVVFEL